MEQVAESLGTLGNGFAGTRSSWEEDDRVGGPLFLVNGIYTNEGQLLPGPLWTCLDRPGITRRHTEKRMLDLRGGTLVRLGNEHLGGRSLRFVSMAMPHAMALRAEAPESHLEPGDPLRPPREDVHFECEHCAGRWVRRSPPQMKRVCRSSQPRRRGPALHCP